MRFLLGGRNGLAPELGDLVRPLDAPCTCGHDQDAHEHFRRGSDCGVCGRTTCRTYRRAGADATTRRVRPAVRHGRITARAS